jgi:hypothetical protein
MTRRKFIDGLVVEALAADADENELVFILLDDSWSTLPGEAELIDRWFGAEIVALFGDRW